MSTRTTLTVPQPCHENWSTMTLAAQGRHCASCNKMVLDFTQKTDAEILALLQRTAAPCGRFRADQLNRPLLAPPAPAPRWRTWLAATATVLGLREVAAGQGYGQHPTAVHHELLAHDGWKAAVLHEQPVQVDSSQHILRGKVIDKSTGQGLPGVTVLLKNTHTGTSTREITNLFVYRFYDGGKAAGYSPCPRRVCSAYARHPNYGSDDYPCPISLAS